MMTHVCYEYTELCYELSYEYHHLANASIILGNMRVEKMVERMHCMWCSWVQNSSTSKLTTCI